MKFESIMLGLVLIVGAGFLTAQAQTGDYAGALEGKNLTSDAGNVCISWTKAREGACKEATQKVKQLEDAGYYEQGVSQKPFGLIEKEQGSYLQFRIAEQGEQPTQGERGFNCDKGKVQQGYRRSAVDIVNINDMVKKLSQSKESPDIKKNPENKQKANPGKPQGGGTCYDDGVVEQLVGKGCGQGDGTKSSSDPGTCITGVICTQQSPLSDRIKQRIKGAGVQCFKEKSQSSVKKDQKQFVKGVQFSTVCYCADDAQKMARITAEDAQSSTRAKDKIDVKGNATSILDKIQERIMR